MKIVLATNNENKIREIKPKLEKEGFEVLTMADFGIESPEETGTTFAENAKLKAYHTAKITGLPTLAEDSGLSVEFLDGRPGVYSARYSGTWKENNQKLLEELKDAPYRTAKFVAVFVSVQSADDPNPIVCHHETKGFITTNPRGENGFAYDELFVPFGAYRGEVTKTFAEMTAEEKDKYSHRRKALDFWIVANHYFNIRKANSEK